MILVLRSDERGYSIPELVTVMILTGFFVTLILTFGFSYLRYSYLLEADQETLTTRLNAADYLRENLGSSSGLIVQNSIPDNHTHNPDPAIPSNLYWTPLHAVPRSTTVGSSGTTPILYYQRLSFNTSENVIMNGVVPYEDEFVLYIDHPTKELRVRSLANPSANGNRLKTSCPPASASPTCPADQTIARDLSVVEQQYFSRSGALVDYSVLETADFPIVEVIEITLGLSKKPLLQKTNATINEVVIRLALRNI